MSLFVERWGVKDARHIIEVAYGPKFKGMYKGTQISDSLFIKEADWMARMFVGEGCKVKAVSTGFQLHCL